MSEGPEKTLKKVDDELSDLLDSALEDFGKEGASKQDETKIKADEKSTEKKKTSEEVSDLKGEGEPAEELEEWADGFIREAAAQFESNMANFLGSNSDGSQLSPEQIQEKFQQMATAAQQAIETPEVEGNSADFAAAISQTLQGLSAGTDNLQNQVLGDDLQNLLGGLGGQEGGPNAFLPFMQGMMQSLLSKEVLYPSLKDILDRFPEYMNRNKETLSEEDKEKYVNQMKLMEEVCAELEKENPNDSVEQKKEHFEKVLGLMQRLQDFGQPPTELVGDVGPPLPINPSEPTDPNQCCVM